MLFCYKVKYLMISWIASLVVLLTVMQSTAIEFNGDIGIGVSLFACDSKWPQQDNQYASMTANVELYHSFGDNISFALEGFCRLDSQDDERSHADLRLAEFLYLAEDWEVSAGVGRVFWGATEFVHLVDIVNQTDLVESLDGEDKLGQPMIHLTIPKKIGVFEAFVLPFFRKRTFPGVNGRFRGPFALSNDFALYESGHRENHIDFALRYSTIFRNADIGISYFNGTSRDPVIKSNYIPYYKQITQSGLDVQLTSGKWLLKGEGYYRTGQDRSYAASTFGFEYTFNSIADTMTDVGVIGEYVFDDRNQNYLPTSLNNDIMLGLRFVLNDMDDSTILLGIIKDLDNGSTVGSIEASRRFGNDFRCNIDAIFFMDMDQRDLTSAMEKDDMVKVELVWYW